MSAAAAHSFASQATAGGKPNSQQAFLLKLLVVALGAGLIVQIAGPPWLQDVFATSHLDLVPSAALLLAALVVSVMVHEIGHLIPSLLFGFHVSRVAIGPLANNSPARPLEAAVLPFLVLRLGLRLPSNDYAWRQRMLIVVASGPIASLALLFVAAFGTSLFGADPLLCGFLRFTAQINLFISVLGVIPNSALAPVRNDARLLLTILNNGAEAEQIRLYHLITRLQTLGVRPRSYPANLVTRMMNATGTPDLMLFTALNVYLWALDSGNLAVADLWDLRMNALVAQNPRLRLSNTALAESACFDLIYRRDCTASLNKLETIDVKALSPHLLNRTKVLQMLAEGRSVEAASHLNSLRPRPAACLPLHPVRIRSARTLAFD